MKRLFFVVPLLLAILPVACQKQQKENTISAAAETTTPTDSKETATGNIKVAYIQMDSLLKNYTGYQEMEAQLKAKADANQASLTRKAQTLQQEMQAFQEKLQSGGFVNELAAQQEYERLQKKDQQAQADAARITEDFLKMQQHYNDSLNMVIRQEVERFNEVEGFDFIFSNVQMSSIVYGNPAYDVTNQVLERLNAGHKKTKKTE